jgi:hypothetical protein
MTTVHRVRAVLKIIRTSTSSVLARAHAIHNGMAANPAQYAAPVPPLAALQAQIAKLDGAEQLAATRAKGAAAARDVERAALIGMLETERAYVQTLADASPDQAVAVIEAAGMLVAEVAVHDNPLLEATTGAPSGTVYLDANATVLAGKTGKKTFFNWQWTPDGGKTFTSAPSTAHGKTTIASLTPFTMVGFRVSVTDAKGPGEWSQVVSLLVQ